MKDLIAEHRQEIARILVDEAQTITQSEQLLARGIALGEAMLLQLRSHYEFAHQEDPNLAIDSAKSRLVNALPVVPESAQVKDLLVHAIATIELGLLFAEGYGAIAYGDAVGDFKSVTDFAASKPNWQSFGG